MELIIYKDSMTGAKQKHAAVISEESEKMIITIVRYHAIPQTIKLKLEVTMGFREALQRINNTIGLDDEIFKMVSDTQNCTETRETSFLD